MLLFISNQSISLKLEKLDISKRYKLTTRNYFKALSYRLIIRND